MATVITLERYSEWGAEQREALDDFLRLIGAPIECTFWVRYDDGFVETWQYREDGEGRFFIGNDGKPAWMIVQYVRTDGGEWFKLGEQWVN